MSGSAIPAALTALVAVYTAAAPSSVTVIDGPAYDPPAGFLAVGWDRSDQPAVTATNSNAAAGGRRGLEQAAVSSLLSLAYDDDQVTTVRNDLFTAFELFDAALAADRTLGGAVMLARVGDYDLTPILTEVGAVMDLRFTTHLETIK